MPVQSQTFLTRRYLDLSPSIALGGVVLVIMAAIAALLSQRQLVDTRLQVREGEPVQLDGISVRPHPIGALRIDVKAILPTNHWVTYEIQLLNAQNDLIGSGLKQAWRESGTWQEGGESGTWEESDLRAGLDLRLSESQAESLTVAIAVLEYGRTSGQALSGPVPFRVTVSNGVVDSRYLWAGLVGSAAFALLSYLAVGKVGIRAIAKTIQDSDVNGRATVGGANRLLRVTIRIEADETAPAQLEARLFIKDGYGEQIYARSWPVQLHFRRSEDNEIEGATGQLRAYFILEPRGSYGFYVEVMPDGPVDWTRLRVLDKTKTRGPVEVTRIWTA